MTSQYQSVEIPALNNFSLSISHNDPHGFSVEREPQLHIHEYFEIYFNLSGDVSFVVENNTYSVSRGTIIITRPFEYHHCIFHSTLEHDHYCLHFSCVGNKNFLTPFIEREKGKNNCITLSNEATTAMINHFEKLMKPSETSEIDLVCHFLRILQIIQDNNLSNDADIPKIIPENLAKVLDIINTSYQHPISVATLAADIYVSINTLERYFKRYLNLSPTEYIKRKRLSAALTLLKNNTPVSSVASQCGFSDTSNFIQVFKRSFGKTPYQYLKKGHLKGLDFNE